MLLFKFLLEHFFPIKSKNINDHKMHSEFGIITKKSAQEINKIKRNGGKIIAVGTTVLRILESSKKNSRGIILPFKGETDIFIKNQVGILIQAMD